MSETNPPPIEIHGLAVGYDEVTIVRDVDLTVRAGEVIALVGANGSGKSTLVRGLLGLARVQAGSVRLFGVEQEAHRRAGRGERHRIGYVPQQLTVGGGIPSTVEEVVASGRLARRPWYVRGTSADREAVARAIDAVGLADRAHATIGHLSGGQQRRGLIARALAAEPEVLIMDEPTAGVDAESQVALGRTLEKLVAQGLTMIVVTHETAPLAGVLTRVVTMSGGRVVADRPAHGMTTGQQVTRDVPGAVG
ncbi:metal ABC transporter ATP-binding protein [Spongisporangium articulatum]|uniref:Metal ABC transporter ATP-binding protein n=1 Tax=Spongisporangium articulatum TaxID=3362603 RepID=A0ABW8ALA9_9ACTN